MGADDLRKYLLAGEKVVWSGQPKSGLIITPRDGLLIPFSLLWGGFAIFWEAMALSARGAPVFFPLFGLVFVLVGLYLIVGRFFVDAWVRKSMSYALTDRRVLIVRGFPFVKLTAISLDRLPNCDLTQRTDGSGTIRFGDVASVFSRAGGWGSWTPSMDPTPQFLRIENVRAVFDQIQRLIAANAQAS